MIESNIYRLIIILNYGNSTFEIKFTDFDYLQR